jgi:ribulose-phosphate 3-epimerase
MAIALYVIAAQFSAAAVGVMGKTEVVPALLAKSKDELDELLSRAAPHFHHMHIDVMDNVFVPNRTIGLPELDALPPGVEYEFHWMVKDPASWISKLKLRGGLHIVHAETIGNSWGKIVAAVREKGGKLGIAINPSTPASEAGKYAKDVSLILVMSVNPGFSGQAYINSVEEKVADLSKKYPGITVEVDGGINADTGKRAIRAGARRLAAAKYLFGAPDIGKAAESLGGA